MIFVSSDKVFFYTKTAILRLMGERSVNVKLKIMLF